MFVPLVGNSRSDGFDRLGAGPFPVAERDKLRTLVATAHRGGRRVRFRATPDAPGPEREAVRTELPAAGAEHLNTDDPTGPERFLRTHDGGGRTGVARTGGTPDAPPRA
ncbi:hypothetical protein ACWCXX_25335 [Streptomyces sp. NPDC001732]